MSKPDTDAAPTMAEIAELLSRDAPPVADVPFTLTTPPRRERAARPASLFDTGTDDE